MHKRGVRKVLPLFLDGYVRIFKESNTANSLGLHAGSEEC